MTVPPYTISLMVRFLHAFAETSPVINLRKKIIASETYKIYQIITLLLNNSDGKVKDKHCIRYAILTGHRLVLRDFSGVRPGGSFGIEKTP